MARGFSYAQWLVRVKKESGGGVFAMALLRYGAVSDKG
jgi:hypothetical protein